MDLLSADDIATGRQAHLEIMRTVAARWSSEVADNGRGGQSRTLTRLPWTWPAWATDRPADLRSGWLPARITNPTDDVLQVTANQYGTRPRWLLSLPALVPIEVEDVVAVADPNLDGGAVVGIVGAVYTVPTVASIVTRALLVVDQQGRRLEDLP